MTLYVWSDQVDRLHDAGTVCSSVPVSEGAIETNAASETVSCAELMSRTALARRGKALMGG